MAARDEWENRFKNWKEVQRKKFGELGKVEQKVEEKIVSEVGAMEKEISKEVREPKHIRVLKIVALLIPVIIVGYLIYSNFVASQEFSYFYDIGSEGDKYLTPVNRVSETGYDQFNYRNLTSGLVYFDVPIAPGSESVKVQVRFKNNLPEANTMSLGAKDRDVWHYTYNSIFNPALNRLPESTRRGDVYLVNQKLVPLTFDELKQQTGIVVAAESNYVPPANDAVEFSNLNTIISTSLRGKHTAYIYTSGDLKVSVIKQDINWYDGSDELEISLYDSENNLIANTTIADDGEIGVNKNPAKLQADILKVKDLEDGVYRLEFGDFDGVIKEISLNTNKIVFEKVFLADNSVYNQETKPSNLYTKVNRNGQLELITYHAQGIQKINYTMDGKAGVFNFYQEDAPLYMNLTGGEYYFTVPQNDIIFSGVSYFAFSKENYFEPFKQKVVPIKNNFDWLQQNVDYLVTDYKAPVEDKGWLIGETSFDLTKENLFVKDNKLSMVFNVPHLSQEEFAGRTIPIDWIKINVYKPGVFEE